LSTVPLSEMCFERARLMTESYRETEGETAITRRAKAFYKVLDGMPLSIDEGELIVGNVASRPGVAYFAPEKFNWRGYRPGAEQVRVDHRFSQSLAIKFRIPEEIAEYWHDKPMGDSAGHFVADYEKVLKRGFKGIMKEVIARRRRLDLTKAEDREKDVFYQAAGIACEAAIRFGERHAEKALELAGRETDPVRKEELEKMARICGRVPAHPAETFHEALQSFWFTHIMLHINSKEWSISPGRFDQYMYPYYRKDVREGRLTREEAEELLACLWIKFNQVRIDVDFVNYQMITLGGQGGDGRDVTNELSYLCLDTTARLRTIQPSLCIRYHEGTPNAFLRRACELVKTGLGMPAMFNDSAIIPALLSAGVAPEDAKDYAIAGCEEIGVPGKLYGVVRAPIVNQARCVLHVLYNGHDPVSGRRDGMETGDPEKFTGFEDFLKAYRDQVRHATEVSMRRSRARDAANAGVTPHSFVSLLFDDCVEAGRDITVGGARYDITSMSEAGSITAANSLAAIEKAVFEDKIVTISELKEALLSNFRDSEALRQYLLKRVPKFGNDDDYVDEIARRVVEINHEVIRELDETDFRGGIFVTGSGASTGYLHGRVTGATPDGRFKGESLSVNLGPSPGTDVNGPTAMLKSVAKLSFRHQTGGALLHMKLSPNVVAGENGTENLSSLIRTYFKLGGMGLHFTVVDGKILRAAKEEPEKYRDVIVRVGGFSAPFVLLSPEIQDNIILRTEHSSRG